MRGLWLVGVGLMCALLLGVGGCGGGGDSTSTSPITVSGTLIHQHSWSRLTEPAVGWTVVIEGHDEVVTDGVGRFVVAGVQRPYTAIVLDPVEPDVRVTVGLTRADPVLEAGRAPAGVQHETDLMGTVTGGAGFPMPAYHMTVVALGHAERGELGSLWPSGATGAFGPSTHHWTDVDPLPITATAIQWEMDGDLIPIAYPGFGTLTGQLAEGFVTNFASLPMAAVSHLPVSGTIDASPGYDVQKSYIDVEFDAGPEFVIPLGSQPPGSFSAAAPVLTAAELRLRFVAFRGTAVSVTLRQTVQPGTTGLALQVPEGALHADPADGATIDPYATVFRITGPSGSVYRAHYSPNFPAPGPYLVLTTTATSWTLPDLSAYGVTLPPATEYVWEMEAFGPATVDDVCDDQPFVSRAYNYSSISTESYFTTTP